MTAPATHPESTAEGATEASLRLLLVTQTYVPFFHGGGPPTKVHGLATELVRRGHQVTVATANWHLFRRREIRRTAAGEAIYFTSVAKRRGLTLSLGFASWLQGHVREFDVAHVFGLYDLFGYFAGRACRQAAIPYLIEPIGMYRPISRGLGRKRLYHRLVGSRLFAGASGVIATSELERRELVDDGLDSGRVHIRANGITPPSELPPRGQFRAAHGIPADRPLILFLGRVTPKKGPDLLLRAAAQLGPDRPAPPWLAIVGPDEGDGFPAQLAQLARQLGLADRVVFTGPIYGDAKWSAYVDADLFALPSENENFGNTIVEAIACGVPAVVSDRCGVAVDIADVAGLVVSRDESAFAAALDRVLSDRALHRRLATGGRELGRRFGWESPALEQERLYRSAVAAAASISAK